MRNDASINATARLSNVAIRSEEPASVVYRYGPRPNTVYLNITNRCTNRCSFCVKNTHSGLSGYRLWLDREPTADEVWTSFLEVVKESDTEVVWCGFGEPTVRLGIVLSLTRRIKVEYPHMGVRLDTDGLAQFRSKEREVASELKEAGVDSVSISLNADNESKYNELCRPALPESYQAVLRFARDCKKHFSKIRLTVPSVPSVDIDRCARIAEELGCEFKVR